MQRERKNDAQNTAKSSKNNDEDNVENEVPLSETTKKTKKEGTVTAGLSHDDEGKTEQLGLGRGYSCVFDQLTHGEDTRTFGLNNESDYTLAAMTRGI